MRDLDDWRCEGWVQRPASSCASGSSYRCHHEYTDLRPHRVRKGKVIGLCEDCAETHDALRSLDMSPVDGRNRRFWQYVNGDYVKLTVTRTGRRQRLTHEARSVHDEGWSCEGNQWTWTRDGIMSEYCYSGVDCDGRMYRSADAFCRASQLGARTPDLFQDRRVPFPEWERVDSAQRDYQAEAAGY